jgi:hypothetical protein
MRTTTNCFITTALLGCCLAGVASAAPQAPSATPQPAVWQDHHAQFDYFGLTSRYTCDGLEGKVRQILEYLGARHDMSVQATGCPRGPESLSRSAWVRVDFSTLSAAPASGNAAETIEASWTPLTLVALRPSFMGDGDCDLVKHMHKLVTDNFSWRGEVAYRADCPISSTDLHDYQVQGEILRPSAPARH